jgi:hypothetical protein
MRQRAAVLQDTFHPAESEQERRSYDLYITYSKFYQVPQFWLVGFSDKKIQLQPKEVCCYSCNSASLLAVGFGL